MMKKIFVIFFILMFGVFLAPANAAKKRVWSAKTVVINNSGGGTPSVSAKLTGWKQYLNLSFRGVSSTNEITYELIFNGNGGEQGIFGDIPASEGNTSRSLFLGTCSHGACTSYQNINSLRLTVTYKMKNGGETVKRYRVKY